VFRWKDFYTEKGGSVLTGVDIPMPQKILGLIEQVVCSGGRVFIGTRYSTYSGCVDAVVAAAR
jgi:hypothetical protein